MHTRLKLSSVILVLAVGCNTSKAPDPLFTAENAWPGAQPPAATQLEPAEFHARLDAGTLTLVTSASQASARAARQHQYEKDLAFLRALPSPSPALRALLEEAATQATVEGDRPAPLSDGGSLVLLGLGTQVRSAVLAEQRAQSVDNALADYALSLGLLSPALRAQLPSAETLSGKPVAAVKQALHQLATVAATDPSALGGVVEANDSLFQLPADSADAGPDFNEVTPGNGSSSSDGPCGPPTNFAGRYWFPLKYFVTPVRNQARRGTCWAFTATAALETREMVQLDQTKTLSTQFLVNKVKQDWDSDEDTDGYYSAEAIHTAANRSQPLPTEGGWTYNPAWMRTSIRDGEYAGTCQGYTGTCSETSHESPRSCSEYLGITICGSSRVDFAGPGSIPNDSIQVWENGDTFDLALLRSYLAKGYPLMAGFPVYRGFDEAPTSGPQAGVVSDYSQTYWNNTSKQYVAGSRGGHEVLIVGFLGNEVLTTKVGGGGLFIIKNSWGCSAGDKGFYYIPADYVSMYFKDLSVIAYGAQRGTNWTQEQTLPGSSIAPTIQIKTNPAAASVRTPVDLANFFRVTHPVAQTVTLDVSSDKDGALFQGSWAVGSGQLLPTLSKSFLTTGSRTVTVKATFGTRQAQASFTLVVAVNPLHVAVAPLVAYQGQPTLVDAVIDDANVASPSELCATTSWSVTAPDTLTGSPGCHVAITFGSIGIRQVQVTTLDTTYGLSASTTVSVSVLPAPANPYPIVTAAGVYARQFVTGPIGTFCGTAQVPAASTLDLKEVGCSVTNVPPFPSLYFAGVTVDNPTAEALTYTWAIYFKDATNPEFKLDGVDASTAKAFSLSSGGDLGFTGACRVTLTVNAPDPARSKTLEVWSGTCIRYAALP